MSEPIAPFELEALPPVGAIATNAIAVFLSAAAVQLGDPLPDGRTLAARDGQEAWLALLSAAALIGELGAYMPPARRAAYTGELDALLARFAAEFPDARVPAPGLLPAESWSVG